MVGRLMPWPFFVCVSNSNNRYTHLTINLDGRVIEHRDDWSVNSLIKNIPLVGTFWSLQVTHAFLLSLAPLSLFSLSARDVN